jgi:hypothetical protein
MDKLVDALRILRLYCVPGMNWTDDVAQLILCSADQAIAEVERLVESHATLLAACQAERKELAADQAGSQRRITRLDTAIALAYEGPSTGDRSEP